MITKCDKCGEAATVKEIKTKPQWPRKVKDDPHARGVIYVIDCPKCGVRMQAASSKAT